MTTCTHHWRIAEPNGPISVGLCQHCGSERPFRNVSWDNLTGDERRQLFLNPRVSPPRFDRGGTGKQRAS